MTIKIQPTADLSAAARWANRAGPTVERQMRAALRETAQPIVSLAEARFRRLPGTGRKTAETVRASATTARLTIRMGGKNAPWAMGREFGAKRTQTRGYRSKRRAAAIAVEALAGDASAKSFDGGPRRIDYTRPKLFDTWTGNKFTLAGTGQISGRALHPSIRDGMKDLDVRLLAAIDRVMAR